MEFKKNLTKFKYLEWKYNSQEVHKRKSSVRSECNGVKYSLVLKGVVFEIKSEVHPGNNE